MTLLRAAQPTPFLLRLTTAGTIRRHRAWRLAAAIGSSVAYRVSCPKTRAFRNLARDENSRCIVLAVASPRQPAAVAAPPVVTHSPDRLPVPVGRCLRLDLAAGSSSLD